MSRRNVALVFTALGKLVSRRAVIRGVPAMLAGLLLTRIARFTGAEHATPQYASRHDESPGEACYRLCAADPTSPLTRERERQCRTGCAIWAEDDELA